MRNFLLTLLLSSYAFSADLNDIFNDESLMMEHVGDVLNSISSVGDPKKCSTFEAKQNSCGVVINDYMKDREHQGVFKLFVDKNPKDMCTSVELNDNYYTSASKLDDFFQDYTLGMVPAFNNVNKNCFDKYSSLKEQKSAISYYYYAQMRIMQDKMMTLNSIAAIDKKLGRPILDGVNCDSFGHLKSFCKKIQTCEPSKKNLSNDIADTKYAVDLKRKIEASDPELDEDIENKKRMLGGLNRLYPWLEGKEFENNFSYSDKDNDLKIENALVKQFEGTRELLNSRITKYEKLSACIENSSSDCDDFHKDLNKLTSAPEMNSELTAQNILAKHYQNTESCINNQRNIRDSANSSANEFIIGSGLTVATLGLGTIAVGSGHLIKGVHTAGALNRSEKVRRSLATFSVQNSSKIKSGAKYLALSLNGAFTARGVVDAASSCKEDLSHLTEFKKLTSPGREVSICPISNENPEFQLMSDIKSCAINAAFASLDFLPAIPYGVSKYRASRNPVSTENAELLNKAREAIDPSDMKYKEMDKRYHGEQHGKSEGLKDFRVNNNPNGKTRKTKYFTSEKMRERLKVHVRDGKLYDSQGKSVNSNDELEGIFVMDKQGEMYFHPESDPGRLHHSSFLAGDDVLSAGSIKIEDGKITYYSDQSGHYKPLPIHVQQGIYNLLKKGADFTDVEINLKNYPDLSDLE
ncbi:MAG: hypothetical protein BM556_11365 [Bacteriovorax sp. MedPE-SWde]|nr:MAG: hypothetical protein BM556_11365 [Bacteriovorax sp. MedPE-SWde]